MRIEHKEAFFTTAQEFTCWIGLREPNPLSEPWVGKSGYRPKAESCKAKSSDNPDFRFAGLVVDPLICPEAFLQATLELAKDTWKKKFLINGNLPPGFSRMETGPERGLVRQQGAAIYADFDLMAISRSNDRGEFLFTTLQEQKQLFAKVGARLNALLGADLIQHGAEFMWEGGLRARESEMVLWFGPKRKFMSTMSSMPKGGH